MARPVEDYSDAWFADVRPRQATPDVGQPPQPAPQPEAPAAPTAGEQAKAVDWSKYDYGPQATGGSIYKAASGNEYGGPEWDATWEKRARKLLGDEFVGSREGLFDPEKRKEIERALKGAQAKEAGAGGGGGGGSAGAGAGAAATPAPAQTTPAAGAGGAGGFPVVPQGSARQTATVTDQLKGLFPSRQVEGALGITDQPSPATAPPPPTDTATAGGAGPAPGSTSASSTSSMSAQDQAQAISPGLPSPIPGASPGTPPTYAPASQDTSGAPAPTVQWPPALPPLVLYSGGM